MINRRHFLSRLSASAALSTQFTNFSNSIAANAVENRNTKSVILLWMGGGPSTVNCRLQVH